VGLVDAADKKTAPDLFTYDDSGCWVSRQPVSADQHGRMLTVLRSQELDCIHYRGSDPKILKALK
jgi:hypothetical protein